MNETEQTIFMRIMYLLNQQKSEKEILETIMTSITGIKPEYVYQFGIDQMKNNHNYITPNDINESDYKAKFGYHNRQPVIHLLLDYCQLSPELFKKVYGFNYTPKPEQLEEVKHLTNSGRSRPSSIGG